MADYYWPEELTPFVASFYLRSHTGRSQSPYSQQQKVYALSAPLWIARLQFRGGYDGIVAQAGYGPALDALLARLKGGQNRAGFWDFRRDAMRGLNVDDVGNLEADKGGTEITLTGLVAGETVYAGDYVGGDGRPHIVTADVDVELDGTAVVGIEPPLNADMDVDTVVVGKPLGWFRLVSDDAGQNGVQVGEAVTYDLEFLEDPLFAPAAEPDGMLRIGGILIRIGGETVEMS